MARAHLDHRSTDQRRPAPARINLLLLLVVALLPFPTRLVAEGLDVSGERVFVTMYGIALLGIRVLLYALDAYAWRERLYAPGGPDEPDTVRQSILPVVAVYTAAILIGLAVPAVALGLYCAIAVVLVVPFGELRRLLFRRA
jgi:uncharacterized membrane protein